jgi:hypothetical protein
MAMHLPLRGSTARPNGARRLRAVAKTLWPRLLVITVLASLIGSSAHAAPPGPAKLNISLEVKQLGGQRTLCVGDNVQFRVKVWQQIGIDGDVTIAALMGVRVDASGGGGVGTLRPASDTTSLSNVPAGATVFTFVAENAGDATLVFKATINTRVFLGLVLSNNIMASSVSIRVEDCQYKVTTLSKWQDPAPGRFTVYARIINAGLTEVGGGLYKGTAVVKWLMTVGRVGNCIPQSNVAEGQAQLSGQVNGPGEILITVVYDQTDIPLPVKCVGESGEVATGDLIYAAEIETVKIRMHPVGGTMRENTLLTLNGGNIVDIIYVILTRAKPK